MTDEDLANKRLTAKGDIISMTPQIKGLKGRIIRYPFRLLTAADEFAKAILRDSEYYTQAYSMAYQSAKNQGLKGDKMKQYIADDVARLIKYPTKEMIEQSEKVAFEYTFQNDLPRSLEKLARGIGKIPGAKYFVPFVKTPTNVVLFQARRSPLGVAFPNMVKTMLGTDGRAGSYAQREALSQFIGGVAMTIGGYFAVEDLWEKGNITAAVPKNRAERDKFYREGKQEYSIKIGDKWVNYQRIQPAGLYLLYAASLKQAMEDGDDKTASDMAFEMMSLVAQGIKEMPFVSGVKTVIDAVNEPERYGKYLADNLTTGHLPNVARDIRKLIDPKVRRADTTLEKVMNMTPGVSTMLEPRINALGGEATYDENPWFRSWLKFISTDKSDDKLEQFLTEVGYTPRTVSPNLTYMGETVKLDGKEYTDYQKEIGKVQKGLLERLMEAGLEKQITEDNQAEYVEEIDDLMNKARREVRDKWKAKKMEEFIKLLREKQ
jgi:hypothetical protein